MAYVRLDDIMDQIIGYDRVFKEAGFKLNGTGVKPWTHRHTKGNVDIDINATGWTYYMDGKEVMDGRDPQSLGVSIQDLEAYQAFQL